MRYRNNRGWEYAYVETTYYGQTVRGFVPLDACWTRDTDRTAAEKPVFFRPAAAEPDVFYSGIFGS